MPRDLCRALTALSLLCCLSAQAHACWHEAAQRHGVPAALLYAIAKVESGLSPRAVNRSHVQRTQSIDIGLMQINSRHLPALAPHGITEESLYEPCTNLDVGAWLLADLFARKGLSWDSIGAYNAACTELKGNACTRARSAYAWKVFRQLPASQSERTTATAMRPQPAMSLRAVRVAP